MRNPYIEAVKQWQYRTIPCGFGMRRSLNAYERELLADLLKEFERIDKRYSVPVVSKLRKVADQCEEIGRAHV